MGSKNPARQRPGSLPIVRTLRSPRWMLSRRANFESRTGDHLAHRGTGRPTDGRWRSGSLQGAEGQAGSATPGGGTSQPPRRGRKPSSTARAALAVSLSGCRTEIRPLFGPAVSLPRQAGSNTPGNGSAGPSFHRLGHRAAERRGSAVVIHAGGNLAPETDVSTLAGA